jgi:hypothetical protein
MPLHTTPLHITKVAFATSGPGELRAWLESHTTANGGPGEARLTTRYLPKRVGEMAGGSLYWIHGHMLVGRSPILGFTENGAGRFWIRLAPELIAIRPQPKRAHQGWRYLEGKDAPTDTEDGKTSELPPDLANELARLGLI